MQGHNLFGEDCLCLREIATLPALSTPKPPHLQAALVSGFGQVPAWLRQWRCDNSEAT